MKNLNAEKIKTLKTWEVKNLLWKLCYNTEEALKELELEEENLSTVKEKIFQIYNENGTKLLFGQEMPCVDTLGVDLGIKDPIIRDTIIERCYRQVEVGNPFVEKAAGLLKIENDGTEQSQRRLIGGLKAIKFTNEEANYLFKTCELYPISIFLSRLINKKNAEIKEANVESFDTIKHLQKREELQEIQNAESIKNTTMANKKTILVENKTDIEMLFSLLKDEKNLDDVKSGFNKARAELDRYQKISDLIFVFNEKGIEFEELLSKKENLLSLYRAMDAL